MMGLSKLRKRAALIGVRIDTERYRDGINNGWGYWLQKTSGEPLYEDGNYCSSLSEVDAALNYIEANL
jgi:hypothetical protein